METKQTGKFIPKYFLIGILGYITLLIFIENFVFSSGFDVLSFRCIDDVAFQSSLNKYFGLHGKDLLFMNDYGYGWLYWFPMVILTLPAKLLFETTGIAWPLLVLPRMQSLFFAVCCCILAYKIISRYTKNEWIRIAVVLLMPLYPSGAYYAGRFGTVNQAAFFSMLSLWLVIRNDELTRSDLRWALLAFAAAMGTKASAVVAAPLLALLILNRYRWKFTRANFRVWIPEIVLAIAAMVFFMSPAVILAPFAWEQAKGSARAIGSYLLANQNAGGMENPLNILSYVTFRWTAVLFALLLVGLAGIGAYMIKRGEEELVWRDYLVIPAGFFVGILYLVLTIKTGLTYAFSYGTAISFVLPMGLLCLERLVPRKHKLRTLLVPIAAIFLVVIQLGFMDKQVKHQRHDNIFRYFQAAEESKAEVEKIASMRRAIEAEEMESVTLFMDYQSPIMLYNSYDYDNITYSQTIWNDLGTATTPDTNLLILSKKSAGFQSEEKFQTGISNYDEAQKAAANTDRESRVSLVDQGVFMGEAWDMIYEDEYSYIFVKNDS